MQIYEIILTFFLHTNINEILNNSSVMVRPVNVKNCTYLLKHFTKLFKYQYSDNKIKLRLYQNLIFCVLIHYFFATLG